jgi:antitoxin component HigA of HigAB toxin-antitoxin module
MIASDPQNERCSAALLELEKRDRLSAKEREFAELLTVLIEAYEDEHYPIRAGSPVEVLVHLMEAT